MSKVKADLATRQFGHEIFPDMSRVTIAKASPISVGIVGAGFAGLRCASALLQHGFKVTILEARNRLGGRVAQSNHLGHLVDLGPNWIHGTDGNPIMDIAKKTETKLHAWEEESYLFDQNGDLIDGDEATEYEELLWDAGLIAEAFRCSNDDQSSIDPNKSLYDFFIEKSEGLFADQPIEAATRRRQTFLQSVWMWSCYIGSPVTRQSLKFFWLEECIEGENPFVAGTYQKILQAVAEPAKESADIRLNTEVVKIHSSSSGGSVEECSPSVEISDGSSFSFDELVVTTPLGWLKENKSAFSPGLPPRLSQAIDNISYGSLDKVYITFPRAFWNVRDGEANEFPSDSSGPGIDPHGRTPNVTAKTAPLHQLPAGRVNTQSPGFVSWLQPNYAPSTNPEQWMQEAVNLAALQGDCSHPTLLFYIQGPQSKHIADLVNTSKNDQERDARLVSFFEPYYSLLPNYDQSDPSCIPKAVLATAWAGDKFAGYGSYSNFQVGLEQGDKDIEIMRHGMPERHVWLAGEHTAPFKALGTSTGAYWSGEAVAKRIAKAYGLTEEDKPCAE